MVGVRAFLSGEGRIAFHTTPAMNLIVIFIGYIYLFIGGKFRKFEVVSKLRDEGGERVM
jgi:hypothetical protein